MPGRPRNARSVTWTEALEVFPPCVVRLAARFVIGGKNVRALSNREIAIASGIPLVRVLEISRLLSWDEVTVGETRRFCAACNFDPTNANDRGRQRDYVRTCQNHPNRPPRYLQNSPFWETELMPLIQHLRQSRTRSSGNSNTQPSAAEKSAA